jgi:basic amino acid/polyamine antiporter, APA family
MAEMAVQPAASESEHLSRKSLPITREMGFWSVALFAFSSIGLAYSGLLPFSTFVGMWPGTNLAGTIAIGALLSLVYAYVFAVIGTIAPHYGADYLVASRVVSPPLAFASSFALVLFLTFSGGTILAEIPQKLIPMFAQTHFLISGDQDLIGIASWVSTPGGMVTVGTIGLLIVYLLLVLPPRTSRWFILIGGVAIILSWGIVCVWLASATPGTFQVSWDRFMGTGSYLNQLSLARGLGMQVSKNQSNIVLAGWMLGLWIFSGFYNPTFFASEVKNPKRNLLMGSWLSLVVSLAILGGAAFLLQRQVPLEWLSAESYLQQTGSFTGTAAPWLPLYAAVLRPNIFLVYVLGLCWAFAYLNLALNFLYTASRIVLAWKADGLVAEIVGYIHPELRSPLLSILFVCVLSEASILEAALSLNFISQVNPVFLIIAPLFLPVLGALLLPFRKPEWYKQAPSIVRYQIGPLPLITLIGALTLASMLGLLVAFALIPGALPLNEATLLPFAIAVFIGLGWFYWRRYSLRKEQNINLDQVYQSIPEE